MGKIFEQVEKYLPAANGDNNFILEIGSDRYEGSTEFFAQLGERRGEEFHTVDLSTDAQTRISQYRNHGINYHIAQGSTWCQQVLPGINKKISVVYLDNFDWIWDENLDHNPSEFTREVKLQIETYKSKHNLIMNNTNSQLEHFRQGKALLPFMHEQGVIACDDTYIWNGCWVGKCGPLVVWLESEGWSIVEAADCGVIIKKIL